MGSPPAYRIDGILHLAELPSLTADADARTARRAPARSGSNPIDADTDFDFAYGKPGLGRFRVNSYRQRGSVNIVVRAVAPKSQTFAELGLPEAPVAKVCDEPDGLILVTGPTGSGKTTTCAAIIDYINTNRRANIITIEDPIEVTHKDKRSIVSQREVGVDTESFEAGMKSVLRQDPNVIYVGEIRNQETLEAALIAAETGHLVISTMYTIDAVETVHRILDTFRRTTSAARAPDARDLAARHHLPAAAPEDRGAGTGAGGRAAHRRRSRSRNVSSDPAKLGDAVRAVIAEGAFYGMQTFDQAITAHYEAGEVSFSDALMHVMSPRDFKIATGVMTTPAPEAVADLERPRSARPALEMRVPSSRDCAF